jgi:hypothetical protein
MADRARWRRAANEEGAAFGELRVAARRLRGSGQGRKAGEDRDRDAGAGADAKPPHLRQRPP